MENKETPACASVWLLFSERNPLALYPSFTVFLPVFCPLSLHIVKAELQVAELRENDQQFDRLPVLFLQLLCYTCYTALEKLPICEVIRRDLVSL